jgi:hypothetical protein
MSLAEPLVRAKRELKVECGGKAHHRIEPRIPGIFNVENRALACTRLSGKLFLRQADPAPAFANLVA